MWNENRQGVKVGSNCLNNDALTDLPQRSFRLTRDFWEVQWIHSRLLRRWRRIRRFYIFSAVFCPEFFSSLLSYEWIFLACLSFFILFFLQPISCCVQNLFRLISNSLRGYSLIDPELMCLGWIRIGEKNLHLFSYSFNPGLCFWGFSAIFA